MKYLSVAVLLLLAGCAPYASEITPASISASRYDDWSCSKIQKEKTYTEESLARVSSDQDDAADRDSWMVFLIGVPTSGGGVRGEVARLKGEKNALEKAFIERDCQSNRWTR